MTGRFLVLQITGHIRQIMDAAIKRSVEIFLQRAAASLPAVLQGDCHIKTCEGKTKKAWFASQTHFDVFSLLLLPFSSSDWKARPIQSSLSPKCAADSFSWMGFWLFRSSRLTGTSLNCLQWSHNLKLLKKNNKKKPHTTDWWICPKFCVLASPTAHLSARWPI